MVNEMKLNVNESQVSNENNNNNGQNGSVDTSNIQHLIDNKEEFDDKNADDIEMQSWLQQNVVGPKVGQGHFTELMSYVNRKTL